MMTVPLDDDEAQKILNYYQYHMKKILSFLYFYRDERNEVQ